MIRVLVLSETAFARAGLKTILREDGRFEPVQRAIPIASLAQLSILTSGTAADVALAEIPDKRQLLSLAPSHEEAPTIPLVLLVNDLTRNELLRALSAGVRGLLRRDARPQEIFTAIEAAAAGLTAFGPEELELLIPSSISMDQVDEPALDALSQRETEVLALMAQGLANKNIADRLHISEHTVKFHVSSILSKLGAASRTEAVAKGLKDGLLFV
jgi:DNA-binding NarL/FixJ family response regulator